MTFTKLMITSADNEDWFGSWNKAETEQEMIELGNKPKDKNEWIDWVLNHVFMFDSGITQEIMDMISYNDSVTAMTLDLSEGHVKIKKS